MQDKFEVKKIKKDDLVKEKYNPQLPNIMGQPRPSQSQRVPNKTIDNPQSESEIDPSQLDIEYDANESIVIQIPEKEQDNERTKSKSTNWEEEEEELRLTTGVTNSDNGFAQGLSFEELSNLETMLQKDRLAVSQKEKALHILQKIQGTELFEMLEDSMENSTGKIAELLDKNISYIENTALSSLNVDFDIRDFT